MELSRILAVEERNVRSAGLAPGLAAGAATDAVSQPGLLAAGAAVEIVGTLLIK
jgi:hypothetical protein